MRIDEFLNKESDGDMKLLKDVFHHPKATQETTDSLKRLFSEHHQGIFWQKINFRFSALKQGKFPTEAIYLVFPEIYLEHYHNSDSPGALLTYIETQGLVKHAQRLDPCIHEQVFSMGSGVSRKEVALFKKLHQLGRDKKTAYIGIDNYCFMTYFMKTLRERLQGIAWLSPSLATVNLEFVEPVSGRKQISEKSDEDFIRYELKTPGVPTTYLELNSLRNNLTREEREAHLGKYAENMESGDILILSAYTYDQEKFDSDQDYRKNLEGFLVESYNGERSKRFVLSFFSKFGIDEPEKYIDYRVTSLIDRIGISISLHVKEDLLLETQDEELSLQLQKGDELRVVTSYRDPPHSIRSYIEKFPFDVVDEIPLGLPVSSGESLDEKMRLYVLQKR